MAERDARAYALSSEDFARSSHTRDADDVYVAVPLAIGF